MRVSGFFYARNHCASSVPLSKCKVDKPRSGGLSKRGSIPASIKTKVLKSFYRFLTILFLGVNINDVSPRGLDVTVSEELAYQVKNSANDIQDTDYKYVFLRIARYDLLCFHLSGG